MLNPNMSWHDEQQSVLVSFTTLVLNLMQYVDIQLNQGKLKTHHN